MAEKAKSDVEDSAARAMQILETYREALEKSDEEANALVKAKDDLEKAKQLVAEQRAVIAEAEKKIDEARIVIDEQMPIIIDAEKIIRGAQIQVRSGEMEKFTLESDVALAKHNLQTLKMRLLREHYVLVKTQEQIDVLSTLKQEHPLNFTIYVESLTMWDTVRDAKLAPCLMFSSA